jgi:hypothetical protein
LKTPLSSWSVDVGFQVCLLVIRVPLNIGVGF